MLRFAGKVAVVTGAGRGQGRSHAVMLGQEGAMVVVSDIDFQVEAIPYAMNAPDDLAATARLVRETGADCLEVYADVRDAAQVNALVAQSVERFGGLDIMVANAGGWSPATLDQMTDAQWHEVLSVNLTGAFHSIRAATAPMIERGGGRIVVTCSTACRQGMPNMANYVASRWGQLGMVKSVAIELGPHNITVNAVCPSTVETLQVTNDVMWRLFRPDLENPGREDAEELMYQAHSLPTAWLQPQDVTEVVRFLVSDEARYVTGTGIDVTAGKASEYAA